LYSAQTAAPYLKAIIKNALDLSIKISVGQQPASGLPVKINYHKAGTCVNA
jgi:hypothetical protein